MSTGAVRWLEPLQPSIPGLGTGVLARIARFDDALTALLDVYPVDHGLDPETRSLHLRQVRQRLAADGLLALAVPARYGGHGRPAGLQVLLQFTCGYHDVNLRDSTGLGHGQLIADNATSQARDRWLPRILAGAIPGVAITESHGGTRVHATTTHAIPAGDGTWQVTGPQDLDQSPDRGRRLLPVLHQPQRAAHGRRTRRPVRGLVPPTDHPGGPVRLGLG